MRKFAPVLVSGVLAVSFSTLAFPQGSSQDPNQKSQGSGSYSQPAQQGSDSQYKQPQGTSTYPSGSQQSPQYGGASSGASGEERHDKGEHKGWDKNKNKDKDNDRRGGDDDDRRGRSGG